MAAALSTPVFAAGNIGGSTTGTTITLTDANGNKVFSSDSEAEDVLNLDGTTPSSTELTNLVDGTAEIHLIAGDVKKFNATASDESDVLWAIDTDDASKLKTDKKYLSIEDGNLAVNKEALKAADGYQIVVYAYTAGMLDNNGALKANSGYITLTVDIDKVKTVSAKFADADKVMIAGDEDLTGKAADGTTVTTALTGLTSETGKLVAFKHTAADMKNNEENYVVNHLSNGESATLTYDVQNDTNDDYADYNTLVTVHAATPLADTDAAAENAEKFVTVEQTEGKDEATVTVDGTPTENGVVKVTATFDYGDTDDATKSNITNSNTTYVIANATASVKVYRTYNPFSGEHFYTTSATEALGLKNLGWVYEGIAWYAPTTSDVPVYRLYNDNGGEHHYTTSADEKANLVAAGWDDEGVAFYSATEDYPAVYRDYNANAFANNHHYTTDANEADDLVTKYGWKAEGIAFYAVKTGDANASLKDLKADAKAEAAA